MDNIKIKLNHLEFIWLLEMLRCVRCNQNPTPQQMLIWMAVQAVKKRVYKNGRMSVVREKSSITLNGAEALVMWEVVDGAIPTDHEIAWKLSIQQKMEKELNRIIQTTLSYRESP